MIVPVIFVMLALIGNAIYGFIVFKSNRTRPANKAFITLSIFLNLWSICILCGLISKQPAYIEIWIRQSYIFGTLVALGLSLLRLAVKHPQESFWQIVIRSKWALLSSVAAGMLIQTKHFITHVTPHIITDQGMTLARPSFGISYSIYIACFVAFFINFALRTFFSDLRKAKGIQREELLFILMGCMWAVGMGITLTLIIPAITSDFTSILFAPLSVVLLSIITAYGLLTQRLMGAVHFFRKLSTYTLLIVLLCAAYAGTYYGIRELLIATHQELKIWPHLIATLTIAFSLLPLQQQLEKISAHFFLNTEPVNIPLLIRRVNRALQTIATLNEMLDVFCNSVMAGLHTNRIIVLLADNEQFEQVFPKRSTSTGKACISKHDHLICMLQQSEDPLNLDTVYRKKNNSQTDSAVQTLKRFDGVLAMRIMSKDLLTGVVLMGERISGKIYGTPEENALQILCNQLAIAIENANLYTQTQDSKVYNDILLENLVSGVIACNRHGIITICNPRAQKIIEKPISSIIGHPLNALPAQLSQILKDALETGRSEQDVEIAIEDKGHDPIFLSVGSSNFHSHTGENLGALLLVNDITTLKQLQTQIRRTDRLASMGTLSAGMAHEIKNPLVTIKTFTQLLPDRYHDAEFRETFFSLMSDEVGRIDKIVNELLLFARPSQPVLENISIHEILTQSLRLVRQQLNHHNIQVQSDFTATQDVICGDSTLLSQAFVNFLLNAHDAMPNGGQIHLRTRKVYYNHLKKARKIPGASETDFIEVNIDDSGEGIKESDLTHVFDPFFTTKSNGTGLGLSISHGIVEEHGGTIDIKSTAGAGTQLSVIFPLIKKESSL
jgi:signal transduction histidine kinase